ncbi:hypothetical protein CFIO01_02289 [Colletotrichum fioriniae PJ7]|uniref:PD-(D/E)XK nuclease-like domain-containing protein n=1 Tax=Colletotrichum fioriniae PJ7 TaxID=1445577 RepID=A0A010RC43_9PEZI|nr:hypothetical protein CFIO01_02289 [Colletotrichum fioriniae PJ7]
MTRSASLCAAIDAWRATVQTPDEHGKHGEQAQPSRPRKRRRIQPNTELGVPLSPPSSHSPCFVSSLMESRPLTGVKRKHDKSQQDNDGDEEPSASLLPIIHDIHSTPRASQLNDLRIAGASMPSLSSASSVSSRTSSPTKQLRRLALQADGFVHRKFAKSRAELPSSLATLVNELQGISYGFQLLPHDMRTEVHTLQSMRRLPSPAPFPSAMDACLLPVGSQTDSSLLKCQFADFEIPHQAYLPEGIPAPPGFRCPPRDLVAWLLDQAEDCEINLHGEPSWNTELHLPMMEWALRPNRRRGLVDYTYCTGAQVVKTYRAKQSASNMVDFCMVIRPPGGSAEASRIDEVRENRPDVTINHTDHGILCKSPIVVSFETKRPGADLEKAMVQMGSWHSSQWRSFLQGSTDPRAVQFLPGVIISGHSWSFVASAIQDGKSILYSDVELGKTSTEFGIITVLLALQHLARWAENTYWPVFKSEILQM